MLFADLGADVLKIEEPEKGDYIRWMDPFKGGMSAGLLALNRGKRSMTLNLKNAQARDILARHEAYQEFQQQLRPHIDDLIVVDYRPESRFWRPSRAISPQNDID